MMQPREWPEFVEREADLTTRNTLALYARAGLYARIVSTAQLTHLRGAAASTGIRHFVLGGGSNLVLTGDFDGLIVHMATLGRQLIGEDANAWYVRANAGESWHDFVQWTLQHGWAGLENLSLIPGTVGAAPIQNIGAYGLEVAERIHALTVFDWDKGEFIQFDNAACRFGYRDSVFKQNGWSQSGRVVVTDVTFRLPKRWQAQLRYGDVANELASRAIAGATARQVADAVIAVRCRKLPDPAVLPNTGSFFQNPVVEAAQAAGLQAHFPDIPNYPQPDGRVKLAAGWLIEQAGWKGRDLGPVGMYEKQALVLVNRGGAKGADVLALMHAVQRDVRAQFAVDLVPEPVIV